MRRWSVLSLALALAVLAASDLALPSTSDAVRGSRSIVCPLAFASALASAPASAPGRGAVFPCCGPPVAAADHPDAGAAIVPQSICCTPSALCAPSLTISSTPNPSLADRRVLISGQMLRAALTPTLTVVLWQRLPAQRLFTRIAQASLDASGKYTVTRGSRAVQTTREWYATANGVRSPTITQDIEAIVTLKAIAGRHRSTTASGQVVPSHGGERVLLQRHGLRGWVTIARPRLSRASHFKLALRLAEGAVELRVVLPADRRNVLSRSATVTAHTR